MCNIRYSVSKTPMAVTLLMTARQEREAAVDLQWFSKRILG